MACLVMQLKRGNKFDLKILDLAKNHFQIFKFPHFQIELVSKNLFQFQLPNWAQFLEHVKVNILSIPQTKKV